MSRLGGGYRFKQNAATAIAFSTFTNQEQLYRGNASTSQPKHCDAMACHGTMSHCHALCNSLLAIQRHELSKVTAINRFVQCQANMRQSCVAWALPWHHQLQLQGWCRQGRRHRWIYRNSAPAASGCSSHCAIPTPAAVPGMHTPAQSNPQLC